MKLFIPWVEIPKGTQEAADMLDHFFTINGMSYWRFRGIADSRLANKLEGEKEELEELVKELLTQHRIFGPLDEFAPTKQWLDKAHQLCASTSNAAS